MLYALTNFTFGKINAIRFNEVNFQFNFAQLWLLRVIAEIKQCTIGLI
jgi:hypothetical protein